MLAVAGIALFVAFKLVWGYDGNTDIGSGLQAASPTELPYTVVTSTATADQESVVIFVQPTPEIVFITELVTVTEYIDVVGPLEYVYIEGPERVIEVPIYQPTVVPTVPPVMAPGTVSICVDAAGVKELFVGGLGIVGGGCSLLQVGEGSTIVNVQVNR